MLKDLYPILLCPLRIEDDYTIYYTPEREVEIIIPRMLSRKLVELCDGTHCVRTFIEYFSNDWSKESLEGLFATLFENEVLLNARDISHWVWKFVKNPTAWKPELSKQEVNILVLKQQLQEATSQPTYIKDVELTTWTEQLLKRRSSRQFGRQKISQESMIRLLWSGYGAINSTLYSLGSDSLYRRTIPSAGALYPITLNLCLFKDVGNIVKGIYRITSNYPYKVELTFLHNNIDKIRRCIVDPRMLNRAVGMIIINGCVSRSSMKYGNRGILYTLLEAGHSAQNIHLFAIDERVATVEVGGFLEDRLSKQLNLDKGVEPLTAVVFGSLLTDKEELETSNPQEDIQVTDIIRRTEIAIQSVNGYDLPFSMVFVESLTSSTGNIWWSCGRAVNEQLAKKKATAEAIEWYICGHVIEDNLVEGSFNDFDNSAVDPRHIVNYLPDQSEKIQPFDPNALYQWFWVEEMSTDAKRLVLADLIFFPYFPKHGKRYAFANSSGAAAHVTVEQAIEHAVLESIEREAFMVTWFNYLKRCLIVKESLPDDFTQRISVLEQIGFRVRLVDITFDLTPVIMIVIAKDDPPFLSCSTASGYDVVQVFNRAMMEAEASIYCYIKDGCSRIILTPSEVIHTMDHGAFYENVDRIRQVEFLFGDVDKKITLLDMESRVTIHSRDELYSAIHNINLSILVAHLSEQVGLRNLPYKVVKVLIPGMVPMNFGHGLESFGLDRVRLLPVNCSLLDQPLDVGSLNRSPHPFT